MTTAADWTVAGHTLSTVSAMVWPQPRPTRLLALSGDASFSTIPAGIPCITKGKWSDDVERRSCTVRG